MLVLSQKKIDAEMLLRRHETGSFPRINLGRCLPTGTEWCPTSQGGLRQIFFFDVFPAQAGNQATIRPCLCASCGLSSGWMLPVFYFGTCSELKGFDASDKVRQDAFESRTTKTASQKVNMCSGCRKKQTNAAKSVQCWIRNVGRNRLKQM